MKILVVVFFFFFITSCHLNKSAKTEKTFYTESFSEWQNQKYSMFIVWGTYSIPAGIWNGKKISGYSEQIQGHARIPSEEYRKLATQFSAENWSADSVTLLAKDNGMKSIIFTSKFHDGFCMYDSKYTEYDVVDATPYKKDIVKELSDACEKHGLKFGLYFSLIDWDYHGALPFTSTRNSDSIPPLHHIYNLNQIQELLTNYGEISELWFDMGAPTHAQSKEMRELVKELQPNCMISGRIWNDQGDFVVMGDNRQPDFKIEVPWQTPASMFHETWGYRSWQERLSVEEKINEKIHDLINVVSLGGNYLLNIGPKGDGTIISFEKRVLAGVGKWLKENGEAIYGTSASSINAQDWGSITSRDAKLYLHITDFPKNNKLTIKGLNSIIKRAYPLSDSGIYLQNSTNNTGLEVDLTNVIKRDKYATVIVLEYEGELVYIPSNVIYPNEDGAFFLTWDNATKYHSLSGHDYYSNKPTVIKTKWLLSGNKKESYEVKFTYLSKSIEPLMLSVNNKGYLIPIPNTEKNLKNDLTNKKINNVKLYLDKINEIELSLEDKSNPHKGLNIEELKCKIK